MIVRLGWFVVQLQRVLSALTAERQAREAGLALVMQQMHSLREELRREQQVNMRRGGGGGLKQGLGGNDKQSSP